MSNSKLVPFTQTSVADPAQLSRALNVMQNALEAQMGGRTLSLRFDNVVGHAADDPTQPLAQVVFQQPFPIENILVGRVQRTQGANALTAAVFADWSQLPDGRILCKFVGLPASTASTWSISIFLVEKPAGLGQAASQVRQSVGSAGG